MKLFVGVGRGGDERDVGWGDGEEFGEDGGDGEVGAAVFGRCGGLDFNVISVTTGDAVARAARDYFHGDDCDRE